jgi:predicted nuclease of predicted toxin-antitoxin system
MKLLLDQNLSFKIASYLSDLNIEVTHLRHFSLETASDSEVWDFAKRNGFIIVTMDSDFSHLSALHGPPPLLIWLRCGNQPTLAIADKLRSNWGAILDLNSSIHSSLVIY